jgi:hypothetical protein
MRITNMLHERRERKYRPANGHHMGVCQRCGGYLVDDHGMDLDLGDGGAGYRSWAMRCVQCGDLIDEIILRNRYTSPISQQTDLQSKKIPRFSRSTEQGGLRAA